MNYRKTTALLQEMKDLIFRMELMELTIEVASISFRDIKPYQKELKGLQEKFMQHKDKFCGIV